MNPTLLLMIRPQSMKKLIILVVATLAIVVMLPVMAVFALGTHTLSFLSIGSSTTITLGSGTETVGLYQGPTVPGDSYAWGNCTYWVFYLRQQAGDPIPTNWGNAATWSVNAILQGYDVDHTPTVGSIMQTPNVDDGLGHVAYVTAVDPTTGAWTISEMNVEGLDIVDNQTYQASAALNFNFIHDKANPLVINMKGNGLL
jgi:surface antigen